MKRTKILKIALGLLLVIIAIIYIILRHNASLPQKQFDLAKNFWSNGDYPRAIREYREIVDEYPDSDLVDDALFWVGNIYYLFLQENQKAVESFRELLQKFPASNCNFEAQKNIAEIYDLKFNDYKRAIVEYQRLVDNYSKEKASIYQFKLAMCYYKMDDFNQAETEFKLLMLKYPNSELIDDAQYQLGNCYYIQGKLEKAINAYQKAIDLNPTSDLCLDIEFNIASCYEEAEKLDIALEKYKELESKYHNKLLIERRIEKIKKRLKNRRR